MTPPYYARCVAQLLSRTGRTESGNHPASRAAAVLRIEAALRRKARAKTGARWATVVVLGYATVAVPALWIARDHRWGSVLPAHQTSAPARPTGADAQLSNASGSASLDDESVARPGSHLLASVEGDARLHLSTGTELAVSHGANLLLSDVGPPERFVLSSGELEAKVAKMWPGQSFIVETPDSEVEAQDTTFVLRVVDPVPSCVDGGRTRLEVHEGIVEVRAHGAASYVHPGESWPRPCPTAAASATQRWNEATAVVPEARPLRFSAIDTVSPSPTPPSSSSDERGTAGSLIRLQNGLFARALRERRVGDNQAALMALEELTHTFPSSPLAESAAVERMRLLEHTHHAAAVSAAREYLQRYPYGFALDDAASILNRR